MTIEELINRKIESSPIKSLSNDEYKKACIDGAEEIRQIMLGYARAAHEAINIWVD
jgi:hypothetical protein